MKELLKNHRRTVAVVMCVFIFALLTGCGMKTNLSVNESFAGERVIVCDELSDTNLFFSSANVQSVTECLERLCPPALNFSYKYSDTKKSKAVYTFTLKFDSREEYISKVAEIIGRTPNVDFVYQSPDEKLFNSGFSISEDFSSADLLTWAKDDLKKELNLSYDLSSMTDTVKITMNGQEYDNDNLMSSRIKLNTISAYKLESVKINTIRYGEDDYEREILISIPKKTAEVLGKENISGFLENVTHEKAKGQWLSDESKNSVYRISFSGSSELVNECTASVFGSGSSFTYVKDEKLYTPFSETGLLAETLSFDRFPCENDNTCNAVLTYKNMDACVFDADRSTLSGSSKPEKGEGLSQDGSTVTLIYKKSDSADVKLYSSAVYRLSEVDVVTDIKADGRVSQSIVLAYPIDSGEYGAQFASDYFTKKFEGSGITAKVAAFNDSGSQFALTLKTPTDTAEAVSELLQSSIGAGNSIEIKGEDKFALYNYRSVKVSVDIADMIKPSGYDGEIMYTYKGTGEAYDVDWTSGSAGKTDVLMGSYRSGKFTHPIAAHGFEISYHVRRLNMLFLMLVAVGAAAVVFGFVAGALGFIVRMRKKRDEAKLKAVETMALVKLPDGTQTLMEIPPEEAANTVVMIPKNDDGLDDDDDEPENVWLFGTALRIFSMTAVVLYFLSFATISWTDLITSNKSISGFDMSKGFKLLDSAMEPRYGNFFMLAVPLLIFTLITLRRHVPKLVANVVCIGMSVVSILNLMALPQTFEEQAFALGAQVGKRFTVDVGWAYNYSLVIYFILTAGFVVLTLMDAGVSIKRKSTKDLHMPKSKKLQKLFKKENQKKQNSK